jgi:hypothetical protein
LADLLRWFKVWTTITDDPHFQELPLEDVGRWILLGAMTASVGERGILRIVGEARRLRELLRVDSVPALKRALARLPNLILSDGPLRWPHGHDKSPLPERGVAFACGSGLPVPLVRGGASFEEWCARHGDFTVTWKNWTKFQRDSTQAQRAKASRSKRRGEERRGEESIPHALNNGHQLRRNEPTGPHQTLLAEYDRLFTAKFTVRPKIVGGRDGAIAKELLRERPLEEVIELLRGYFKTGTRFSRERGAYTLGAFRSQYTDLLVMKQRGEL